MITALLSDVLRPRALVPRRLVTVPLTHAAAGLLCVAAAAAAPADAAPAAAPAVADVRAGLAKRLPKTKVTAISCDRLGGLCEVTAGTTLFYTDAAARYLIIGHVYDMATRSDLTAAKLLALDPDSLLRGAARSGGSGPDADTAGDDGQPTARVPAKTVALAELPAAGAIRWGPLHGPKVVVFTDFRCGYCQRLSQALTAIGARVEERPISVLGSRQLSEKVYCAPDPAAALRAAYAREEPSATTAKCDVSGLDANEAFARRHGFSGTPVVVRADGVVIEGFRPADELAAWLKGAAG